MELFQLHAFTVEPGRTASGNKEPDGGVIRVNKQLRQVIHDNVVSAQFEKRTEIVLDVDTKTRSNETRDLIMTYAFGSKAQVSVSASRLARRLSDATDMRSAPCLFVVAAMRKDATRRVTMWTFPKDQAIRFRSGGGESSIQVLTDVFSQTSKLRKAALFEGREIRTHFLTGRVLDFQSNHISHEIADFWIKRFLQCKPSIAGDAGTRLLAKTLKKAMDGSPNLQEQEQFLAAIMAVRQAPQRRWSLQQFANQYLTGSARLKFLTAIPNEDSRVSEFDFRRNVFDGSLKFGVYALDTGVWVSSPFPEIGQSVKLTGTDVKRLSCEGTVVQEKVRSRHA